MANDPRSTPSNYPPSMGPGARPVEGAGRGGGGESARTKLMEVMQARAKYQVGVQDDTLSLSYEIKDTPRLYKLSFDSMGIHGLTRQWIYGGSKRTRRAGTLAIDMIRGSENVVERPVTQQEAEALTYWMSKRLLYGSWATGSAIVLGTVLARRGHLKMKFPIMPAKPREQYNHFPLQRVPIFTGRTAQGAWQFTRYYVWIQVAVFFFSPFFGFIGSTQTAYGMMYDPRMQGLVQGLKERGSRINQEGGIDGPRGGPGPIQQQIQRQRQDSGQEPQSDYQPDYQDMEPASEQSMQRRDFGNGSRSRITEDTSYERYEPSGASDTGTISDFAVGDRETQAQSSRQYPKQQPQRQVQSTRPSTFPESDPFFDDDASPTAGNDHLDTSPRASGQSSGGSAWDRVRGGASRTPAQPRTPRDQEARNSRAAEQQAEFNERNAYSNEARMGAGRDSGDRERAQREFDEMLEKERQQSGSGEYDRGMKAVEQGEEARGGDGIGAWDRRRGN